LELALQLAQRLGMEKVLVVAALGERWDQTIANLLLPVIYPGLQISFVDGQQEVFLLRSKNQMTVRGSPGDTVSLIPISGDAKGITTSGLEYTLSHETLFFGSTRGISNVLLSDNASIMLEEGLLLCVVIHIS
jgi:thiamine pyrophosphokinase